MPYILVIDDEKQILDIVKQALLRFGYDVEIALDGLEGIKKFDNNCFDLVITDIVMPGIDGNTVARHIRNSGKPNTPIIGFSGTPWLLENGEFDAVFPKPFSLKDLINTIQNLAAKSPEAVAHM